VSHRLATTGIDQTIDDCLLISDTAADLDVCGFELQPTSALKRRNGPVELFSRLPLGEECGRGWRIPLLTPADCAIGTSEILAVAHRFPSRTRIWSARDEI
jgi:hypothetical protein